MNPSQIIAFSVSFLLVTLGFVSALNVVTMDTSKSVIDVTDSSFGTSSSGILKSHSSFSYKTPNNKALTIRAPSSTGIVASIRILDLRPGCQDKLTLTDALYTYNTVSYCNTWSISHREIDPDETKTFYARSGKLLVQFTTSPGSSIAYDGFQLTYTAVSSIPCRYNEFRCANARCINNLLVCDGHNHCGDNSDQRNCGSRLYGQNPGRVVGIVFGVIFLITAVVCGIYVMIRRRQRTRLVETTVIHPPPFPSNQPTSYPGTCYPPPPPPYTAYPQGQVNPGYR